MPTQNEEKDDITTAYKNLLAEFQKERNFVNDTTTASLLKNQQALLTSAFTNYQKNSGRHAPAMIITLENIARDLTARKKRCLGLYVALVTLAAFIILAFAAAFIATIHFTAPATIVATAAVSFSANSLSIGFFAGLVGAIAAAGMTFITGRNKQDECRAATRILTHLGTFKTKIDPTPAGNCLLNNTTPQVKTLIN